VRAVHSSGGAAGGVVSEGQGYGLFLGGAIVAVLPRGHARRAELTSRAYEYFLGWRKMCELTAADSCQEHALCGGEGEARHECLPSWKFDDRLTAEIGTGSATDGDADAILGMLLLVLATEYDSPRPAWSSKLTKHESGVFSTRTDCTCIIRTQSSLPTKLDRLHTCTYNTCI